MFSSKFRKDIRLVWICILAAVHPCTLFMCGFCVPVYIQTFTKHSVCFRYIFRFTILNLHIVPIFFFGYVYVMNSYPLYNMKEVRLVCVCLSPHFYINTCFLICTFLGIKDPYIPLCHTAFVYIHIPSSHYNLHTKKK